jgi:hypothetical protein
MSMDVTDTKTVYEIKKKDGALAMRVSVEYFDLDLAQLGVVSALHLGVLAKMQEIGAGEAARRGKPVPPITNTP